MLVHAASRLTPVLKMGAFCRIWNNRRKAVSSYGATVWLSVFRFVRKGTDCASCKKTFQLRHRAAAIEMPKYSAHRE